MEERIDKIINRLRELKIEASKLIYFNHLGNDISYLIEKLESDEDVVELAHKILDGTIKSSFFEDDEIEELELNEDEQLHFVPEDEISEQYPSSDNDEDYPYIPDLARDAGLTGVWISWADVFEEIGYEFPESLRNFPFTTESDFFDIVDGLSNEFGEASTKEIVEKFFGGEFLPEQLAAFANQVMSFYDNSPRESEESFQGSPDSLEEEMKEEDEKDIELFTEMVKEDLNYLEDLCIEDPEPQYDKNLNLEEMEYVELDELWAEIDEKIEKRERDWEEEPALSFVKSNFRRVCDEIMNDFVNAGEMRIHEDAYDALQEAAEEYLVGKFERANKRAKIASRTFVSFEDFQEQDFLI